MKNLIFFTFLMLISFSKAYSQKAQILNGNVKGIINNKLILSKWTDEGEISTASLFQMDAVTKTRQLIEKELRHDQITVIDDKSLMYINDNLYVYDISNKQKKALYKMKESFELVGISLDNEKENVYVVEVNKNKNLFNIVRINLRNQVSKVVASTNFDLEAVEYVDAEIVENNNKLYILIDFTLYNFNIINNQLDLIDSGITDFALDNEYLYFFQNYTDNKPKLEVLNLLTNKRFNLDKIGKYKIVESIYSCEHRKLQNSIINNNYKAALNYCDGFFKAKDLSFEPTDKFILFENEKVQVFKTRDNFLKQKTSYIIKK
jgi:hypothetical protein